MKSSEPRPRYGSGIGAQTNIVPFGFATGQPIRARPSQSASRRERYTSQTSSGKSGASFIATIEAIWIGWKVP